MRWMIVLALVGVGCSGRVTEDPCTPGCQLELVSPGVPHPSYVGVPACCTAAEFDVSRYTPETMAGYCYEDDAGGCR